jgi:hypothetical protein
VATPFSYELYGFRLASELELPGLAPAAAGACDVELVSARQGELGPYGLVPPDDDLPVDRFELSERGIDLVWGGDARVRVRDGASIALEHRADLELAALRAALLGPVMAALLAQRGVFPLHASAVELDGGAVALAGASGEGKSTMAAALLARGHALLSDDVAGIEWRGDRPWVVPAFPVQKLAPETLAAVGETAELAPVHSQETKRLRPVHDRFARSARPLRALLLLASTDRDALVPLGPQESFVELVRHTYRLELVQAVLGAEQHLAAVARLAGAIPVLRLERRRGLERLHDLAALVAAELARVGSEARS